MRYNASFDRRPQTTDRSFVYILWRRELYFSPNQLHTTTPRWVSGKTKAPQISGLVTSHPELCGDHQRINLLSAPPLLL